MHDRTEIDEELLSRMQRGDEQAFIILYRRRQAGIYRFALNMSGSAALAEDITQDVFLALIRGECGYDPARGSLAGYLYGIARKLFLRHVDRGRFDAELHDMEDSAVPELAVVDDPLVDITHRETLDGLRRAVLALPRRYREVVVLCDLEEVDYSDAALALGCPIGTIRSRLHRARALLLEKLQAGSPAVVADRPGKAIRCLA